MTPKEVKEAAALVNRIQEWKDSAGKIKAIESSISAVRGELVYKIGDKSNYSALKFEITSEEIADVVPLIVETLQKRATRGIERLVELGIEAE